MPSTTIKKIELIEKLSQIPDQRLDEVDHLLKDILTQSENKQAKPRSLKGIWKNKGFEKIDDLESELKTIRTEMADRLLKKDL